MRKDFGSKSWFYPLPVLIIGTYGEDGTPDAMNAAWGGLYDADKVVLCLSAGHKTTANIRAGGPLPSALPTQGTWWPPTMWGWCPPTGSPASWRNPAFTRPGAGMWMRR